MRGVHGRQRGRIVSGDIPVGFRVRAHRGWSQTGGLVGAGAAGLLVIAGCTGRGPGRAGAAREGHHRQRQPDVQLGRHRGGGAPPPRRTSPLIAGPLITGPGTPSSAGLSGPGSHETASGGYQPGQRPTGGQRPFQGLPGGQSAPVDLRPDLGVRVAVRDGRLTGVSVRPVAGRPWQGRRGRADHGGEDAGRVVHPGFAELAYALGAGAVPDLPGHRDGRGSGRPAHRHGQRLPHAAAAPHASPRPRFSARGRPWAWACPS